MSENLHDEPSLPDVSRRDVLRSAVASPLTPAIFGKNSSSATGEEKLFDLEKFLMEDSGDPDLSHIEDYAALLEQGDTVFFPAFLQRLADAPLSDLYRIGSCLPFPSKSARGHGQLRAVLCLLSEKGIIKNGGWDLPPRGSTAFWEEVGNIIRIETMAGASRNRMHQETSSQTRTLISQMLAGVLEKKMQEEADTSVQKML